MKLGYKILILVVVLIFIGVGALLWWDAPRGADWSAAGQRGDYWGGHLAAASGIASALLFFIAILMQRDELELTRTEMEASRKVFEAQEDHMAEQKKIAMHSSIAAQLIDICRLRNELSVSYTQATHGGELLNIVRRMNASVPILVHLLNAELWGAEERAHFAKLANAKRGSVPDACDRVEKSWFLLPDGGGIDIAEYTGS